MIRNKILKLQMGQLKEDQKEQRLDLSKVEQSNRNFYNLK